VLSPLCFSSHSLLSSSSSFSPLLVEVLGARLSIILIWLMTGVLVYEAVGRIQHPEEVDGKLMFYIALMGLCVNIIMGIMLSQGGHTHSHGLGGGGGGGDHGHSHASSSKKKKSYGSTDRK
jgi:zinc transporter 2